MTQNYHETVVVSWFTAGTNIFTVNDIRSSAINSLCPHNKGVIFDPCQLAVQFYFLTNFPCIIFSPHSPQDPAYCLCAVDHLLLERLCLPVINNNIVEGTKTNQGLQLDTKKTLEIRCSCLSLLGNSSISWLIF